MKRTIKLLLLALVYALVGKLALRLAFVNASATAVWPPAGIALAAYLFFGYRVWPGIFLGAFVVNLSTAGTILTSLGIATGNTLEGLVGAYLVNSFAHGRDFFDHPYDVFKYFISAAVMSPMVSATVGVTTLVLGGFASLVDFSSIWLTWWLGDAGGVLLVAPFLLLWCVKPRRPRWRVSKWFEAAFVVLTLVFIGWMVFGGVWLGKSNHYPLEFLCTPVVLWAAFRLGRQETTAATLLLSILAVWGTMREFGPFGHMSSPNDSLLLLQMYMGVVAVTGLAVAAVVSERQRALRTSEARFDRLMKSNIIGIMTVDAEGVVSDANDTFLGMVSFSREDMARGILNVNALTPTEYQAQEAWAREQLSVRGTCPALEKEFIHREGTRIPVLVGGIRLDRDPERSLYFVIDASQRRQAMQALRKAYDEMEIRVEERTKELSELNWELSKEVVRRKQAEEELRNLSLSDPLTGLYNRRGFLALSEQQWLQAFRDKRNFFLFFVDVDGLKPINDTLGHAKGDQALIEAADALRRCFRKSDILARIGGDEFAVLAAEAPLDQAQAYFDRLQTCLNETNDSGRLSFKLSLSIGVAAFDQKESSTIHELMRRADEELYACKTARAPSH